MQRTIEVLGVDFDVEYDVIGRNRPATHWEPPEYAEAEVTAIYIDGQELSDVLSEKVIQKIKDKVDENFQSWADEDRASNEADAADMLRDMERDEELMRKSA